MYCPRFVNTDYRNTQASHDLRHRKEAWQVGVMNWDVLNSHAEEGTVICTCEARSRTGALWAWLLLAEPCQSSDIELPLNPSKKAQHPKTAHKMQLPLVSMLFLLATSVSTAVNGPCKVNGTPGVCISTASCARDGGKSSTANFCPMDPADIQCCTKTACVVRGDCRWTSQCPRTSIPASTSLHSPAQSPRELLTQKKDLCPGPADFMCCPPLIPEIPTANCKPHVVTNGYKILNQFPGKVHTVWCYANKYMPSVRHPRCRLTVS